MNHFGTPPMLHVDKGTLFALILTLCETIAVGGIAAVLLFPNLMGKPPDEDESDANNGRSGAEPQEPQPQVPEQRIRWSLGAPSAYATRQR